MMWRSADAEKLEGVSAGCLLRQKCDRQVWGRKAMDCSAAPVARGVPTTCGSKPQSVLCDRRHMRKEQTVATCAVAFQRAGWHDAGARRHLS
eukprot:1247570-Pyramimonas_sp.AAC.1